MVHQNFQEAIEQLLTNEGMDSEEIKKHFNLDEKDMTAVQPDRPLMQTVVPQPTNYCCCCFQSDN